MFWYIVQILNTDDNSKNHEWVVLDLVGGACLLVGSNALFIKKKVSNNNMSYLMFQTYVLSQTY